AESLLFADMNRDGKLDLVVIAGSHTAIYLNEGGKLSKQPAWRCRMSETWGQARVADLDKDGYPDLVVCGRDVVEIYTGGPTIPVARPDPFPTAPALPALPALAPQPDVAARSAK